MKNKLLLTFLIIALSGVAYSSPIAGVSGISGNSDRGSGLSIILEQHLLAILKNNGFNTVQPEMINRELNKFSCTEEKCILDFAVNADIDLIISGTVTDRKKYITIKLQAFGTGFPFNRRIVYSYEVRLPMDVSIGSREFSLICEEHAARFITGTLKRYLYPENVSLKDGSYSLPPELKISGKFLIYTPADGRVQTTGEAEISDSAVKSISGQVTPGKSFILLPFKDKGDVLEAYYTARKREIIFPVSSWYDTLTMAAIIPFASATMPFTSPFIGYMGNNDWTGLGLWMLNTPPYLYMEARGFINSPDKLKENNKDIRRDDRAMNYFAWYMLCAGGMPLFMDAYAGSYLHEASYFTGRTDYLGNRATAGMLSLTSNGAGHFYRGERFWGYFYFHLNNILLYMTMREYSRPEYYNEATGGYDKGKINKNRAIAYSSVLALSKTIEFIHAVTGRENLSSGEVTDEYIIPEPLFTLDRQGDPVFGLSLTLRF